ncbi:MAG: VIT domain-containing protein [Caulobacter sp.]|nr:VIT domain-containing protein [Caulobacter sp.]
MASRGTWLGLAGLILAFGLGGVAPAADAPKAPNPQLTAENYRDGQLGNQSGDLRIGELDIAVDLNGPMAQTTVTVQFDNPTDRELEGDFTLDLPAGSLITGYALDVEGALRPGVLIGAPKARAVYEDKVRAGIDPGIAEVTRTNAFRTSVFPILPGRGRTIRLSFVTALSPDTPYRLPLVTAEAARKVSVSVTGQRLQGSPQVIAPDGALLAWSGKGAAGAWKARSFNGALTISEVKPANAITLSRHDGADAVFDIVDSLPPAPAADRPRVVRVLWDRSLSRKDDDLTRERDLLHRYLAAARPERIDLVTFASDAPRRQSFTDPAALDAALAGVTYRGGTALTGVLDRAEADVCLLFTDGNLTLDAWSIERQRCVLIAVSTAPDANAARLAGIARRSGGVHIDLAGADPAKAAQRIASVKRRIVEITAADGRPLDAIVLEETADRFRILGRADLTGDVLVRLTGGGVRRYSPAPGTPRRHEAAGAYWGVRQIADAEVSDRPDTERLVSLARRWSVATPVASFIVLETMEDYADAGIEPPASVGKAALAEYRQLADERRKDEREEKANRLDDLITAWDDQKQWWNTRFPPVRPDRGRKAGGRAEDSMALAPASPPPPPPPPAPSGGYRDDSGVGELIVTGQRREESHQDVPIAVSAFSSESLARAIQVEMEPWNPDRPYLKALDAAAPDRFEAVLAAMEAEHAKSPAFYLDVAEWLFRTKRTAEAVQMALSALDMPQANDATLMVVGDRMMRYGQVDRALWLLDRLVYLTPDKPQPLRGLALALIARAEQPGTPEALRTADYRRAADLLNKVIVTPWENAYDGIEMVSLMEINRILPRLPVKDRPLDPRLIALLDVDLRVVLEWNTDDSDMDLWVLEPSGDTAIYSNPRTRIGGRLSNDMTGGYGPEEYLLRRAPRGEYQIKANVYAPDALDPNGATTVRSRLYRNWGRPNESYEVLEIDLTPDTDDTRLIGKFRVGRLE